MTVSLRQFRFQNGPAAPHLLITGGVHGDEFEPIAAITTLIRSFRTDDSSVQGFRGTVTLVPIVNESAYLRGHRCGDDGKDLARTCPGRADGTVTEQMAWVLSDQRRMAKAFNLPVIWGTSPYLEGRSLSVARDCNVPAIYCEYLGSATCSAAGIDAYVDGCLNVMAELGMLDRDAPPNRVSYVVEDTKPGSGHMQVCNPAPCTGYFHTSLRPGDRIRSGDVMGVVFPLDQTEPMPILAEQSGIVLVLRTFPRVQQDDSIGVILEV